MSERAFEIYKQVVDDFNSALRENLTGEDDETVDYVEQRILDEYRPWYWKK